MAFCYTLHCFPSPPSSIKCMHTHIYERSTYEFSALMRLNYWKICMYKMKITGHSFMLLTLFSECEKYLEALLNPQLCSLVIKLKLQLKHFVRRSKAIKLSLSDSPLLKFMKFPTKLERDKLTRVQLRCNIAAIMNDFEAII